jgi:diguanylate cyclase
LAFAATVVFSIDEWFVLAIPPLVPLLRVFFANRVRAREEREAWQRLARTTDELNSVDLTTVLQTATTRAAELFSADEVEIAIEPLNSVPARIVRGGAEGVTFDGPPADAPLARGMVIPAALESHDGEADVGELRLRFRGQVKLSEREGYTLHTFAAALCTAIRNASAFAETHRLAAEHALAASLDPLTGLANRRRLFEYGAEVLTQHATRGTTALLLVDLNHFKEVNDTLGHNAGDRVLVEVARRLAGAAGEDDLVARLGGDEFAILFVGLPAPAVAIHRAAMVLNKLGTPIELDGMRLNVEASGGVAPAAGTDSVVELLRRADVAMYQAKRTSQRVCAYDRTRDTADVGALVLGGDLARALAEDQFMLNYQPIVDIGTGEVIAAEALARWSHPDLGDLRPGRFLDAIERSGQLQAFAEAVLDQALVAVRSWTDAGFPIPVAVNVSPRSLLDPKFPDVVKAHLEARHVPAELLILELTETLTLSQLEVVDEVLGSLREAGVMLALDDFGTGYSSLATLARVPVQELKIDRSFVSAMQSPIEAAVVRSTIELARSLDLLVVAEGVESDEQRRQLWDLGCPAGQGHLFGRPIAADNLLAAMRRGFGGRPGVLVTPLHEGGSVVRIPTARRGRSLNARQDRSG